jgi:serine/threonine protein kinase
MDPRLRQPEPFPAGLNSPAAASRAVGKLSPTSCVAPRGERPLQRKGPVVHSGSESYTLDRRLQDGRFQVFTANRRRDGARFVLKLGSRERIVRELAILDDLRPGNPHIMYPVDRCTEGAPCFLVLPYAAGGDLEHLILRGGYDAVALAQAVLDQMIVALWVAHVAGIVHADIKPANILIDGALRLADWDLAVKVGADPLGGTATFAAPEFPAPASPAHDIFSLGVTLFALFARRVPKECPSEVVKECEGIPRDLLELMLRMVSADPANRPTIDQLVALRFPFVACTGCRLFMECRLRPNGSVLCPVCQASTWPGGGERPAEEEKEEKEEGEDIPDCPKCRTRLRKEAQLKRMECPACRRWWCATCGEEIPEDVLYEHFLHGGCPLWSNGGHRP